MKKNNTSIKENSVICILGMHRSGTSLVARVANICGLPLGNKEDLYYESNDSNKSGHWEHLGIFKINEAILSIFNGSWDKPPIFPKNWEDDPRLDTLYKEASILVREMNSIHTMWGFKEPRTCLTLPFWQKVIPNMKYIIPVRFPKDTADSLRKRNAIKVQDGILLWLTYWRSILNGTKNRECLFVHFDKFFNNLDHELHEIITFMNLDPANISHDTYKIIKEFVSSDLYHNKSEHSQLPNIDKDILIDVTVNSFLLGDTERDHIQAEYNRIQAEYNRIQTERDRIQNELEIIKKSRGWKIITVLRNNKIIFFGYIAIKKILKPLKFVLLKIFSNVRLFFDYVKTLNRKGSILVASARNEGIHLLEWICYHRSLGFDHIIINSNDNEDGSEELLKQLSRNGIITYHNTTGSIPENTSVQSHVLSGTLKSKKVQRHEWICVLDIDEFLFLKKHQNIQEFLKDYSKADGIAINWSLFGTGGVTHRTNELTLDQFSYQSPVGLNGPEKTIARVDSIKDWIDPHRPIYKNGGAANIVFPDGRYFTEAHAPNPFFEEGTDITVVNHYLFRSFEDFLIKRYRGGGMKNLGKNIQAPILFRTFDFYELHNSKLGPYDNKIRETSAYKKLKDEMSRITHELQLKPILERIEEKTKILSRRAREVAQTDPLWKDIWNS